MSDFTFENQGTSTYLVCNLTEHEIDSMSLGMITNNRIPGFAPALYTQQDEQKYMKYNVTSKVALRQFLSGTVNKKQLLGVFTSIATAFLAAEEYMLDGNSILLNMDYIFADVTSCKAEVICVPVLDVPTRKNDIGTFFKTIMFSTQLDANENCGYVARIINYLNSTPSFSLTDFATLLSELENMTVVLPPNAPYGQQRGDARTADGSELQRSVPVQPQVEPQIDGNNYGFTQEEQRRKEEFSRPRQQQQQEKEFRDEQEQIEAQEKGEQREAEKMSLLYLLQHYNKENAQKYKAQKEAGKSKGKEPKEPKPSNASKKEKKKKKEKVPGDIVIPQVPSMQAPGDGSVGIQQEAGRQTTGNGNRTAAAVNGQPQRMPDAAAGRNRTSVQQQASVWQQGNPAGVLQTGKATANSANFGETTILSQAKIGETTVLTGLQPQGVKSPYLIRAKNHERIPLNRPVFRIGKEKSFVDYFVGDNTAVSRSHANFFVREGSCYVMDMNSTNHTFVNGQIIASSQEILLQDGDRVSLADEEFEFKMM